ncbi:MAG: VPLPA-CTERM sorting domain-containing protein [Gammaproteobacteria bacterium]|nr:VPLPA-CTERM sorting domain-containing protein [Gammaproteobacteria bacterium]
MLFILFFIQAASHASILSINSTASGYAVDGGTSGGGQMDGTFDIIGTADDIFLRKINGTSVFNYAEFRGVYEFSLPTTTVISSDEIISASLNFTSSYTSGSYGDGLRTYGYVADGNVSLDDFSQTSNNLGYTQFTGGSGYYNRSYSLDVTDFLITNIDDSNNLGFLFDVSYWNVYATLGSSANLSIEYAEITTVPVPAAMWLFSSGLIGLLGLARRK